jgi:hypothetical protein
MFIFISCPFEMIFMAMGASSGGFKYLKEKDMGTPTQALQSPG